MSLRGMREVARNLQRAVNRIEGATEDGLREGGLVIEDHALAETPLDTGALSGSSFVDTDMAPRGPRLRVGFTEPYAPFVHEMPESNNFTTPGTGPKFLEKAVRENEQEILAAIQREARIR